MWILGGFNWSPAFDKSEKQEKDDERHKRDCVCFLFCAQQKVPAFSAIIGLPDQYRHDDETVMEVVVSGSGDIFCFSPSVTAFRLMHLK